MQFGAMIRLGTPIMLTFDSLSWGFALDRPCRDLPVFMGLVLCPWVQSIGRHVIDSGQTGKGHDVCMGCLLWFWPHTLGRAMHQGTAEALGRGGSNSFQPILDSGLHRRGGIAAIACADRSSLSLRHLLV